MRQNVRKWDSWSREKIIIRNRHRDDSDVETVRHELYMNYDTFTKGFAEKLDNKTKQNFRDRRIIF